MAHRHPHRAPVQRIGATRAEHHRIHAQTGGVTEDGPEVLMVIDTFENRDRPGAVEHLGQRQLRGSSGRGQHAPVEVEAHHVRHHLGGGPIERGRRRGQVAGEFAAAALSAQQGVRDEPRRQHALHHQHALGDHQTLARRQIRAAIDAVEVAEVIDPGIGRIGDVDDRPALHGSQVTVIAMPSDPEPPPLPAALLDPRPVIVVGAALWVLAALAAFIVPVLHSWRPITVAGLGVGVVGTSIFLWQAAAARRGARGAQTGIPDEI